MTLPAIHCFVLLVAFAAVVAGEIECSSIEKCADYYACDGEYCVAMDEMMYGFDDDHELNLILLIYAFAMDNLETIAALLLLLSSVIYLGMHCQHGTTLREEKKKTVSHKGQKFRLRRSATIN